MKKQLLLVALLMFVIMPLSALAMSHGKDGHAGHDMDHSKMGHSTMDHGSKESSHAGMDHGDNGHGGMGMHGEMESLGSEVKDGVKASARMKDVSAAMAKMGMAETHHMMVSFASEKNGTGIEKGTVAVKVISPDETEAQPVKMMPMAGAFGADLALTQKGMYHFYIGTKLEDGTKRQYHFHAEIK